LANLLHIETATQVCSIALSAEGKIKASRESREKNIHSSIVTVFIDEVMKECSLAYRDLDAVVVSKGPGSYTGLRIGVSTAKGICFALDKPLIAISSLLSMANGMRDRTDGFSRRKNEQTTDGFGRQKNEQTTDGFSRRTDNKETNYTASSLPVMLCPMIDARRMEVYYALFDQDLNCIRETKAEIIDEYAFSEILENHILVFAGDGAEKCKPLLGNHPHARFIDDFFPSAKNMVLPAEKKFQAAAFEDVAYFEPFYLKDFIPGIPKIKGLHG